MKTEQNYLYDIAFLRVLSTLLVVFVHAFYIYNYGFLKDFNTTGLQIQRFINLSVLGYFRMPIFCFISGYLLAFLYYEKNKYQNLPDFLKNKIKRLIIPYLVFAPMTFFTISYLTLDFQTLLYPIGHLWFLLMLFWSFIISRLLMYLKWDNPLATSIIIACSLLLCYFGKSLDNILGLRDFAIHFIFFYLGIAMQHHGNILYVRNFPRKSLLFLAVIIAGLIYLHNYLFEHGYYSKAYMIDIINSCLVVTVSYLFVNRFLQIGGVKSFNV